MLRILLFLLCLKQCCTFFIFNNDSFVKDFDPMEYLVGDLPIPDRLDYRDSHILSPVKDQKDCAAGWAFAIVASIESSIKKHHSLDVDLSEQFLIDCDDSKTGCTVNRFVLEDMPRTYAKIMFKLGGLIREEDYPYLNQVFTCGFHIPPLVDIYPITGFVRVAQDEYKMAQALWTYGPLSAVIDSSSMGRYISGTIDEPNEDCYLVDHAVLIVGYDVTKREDGSEIPYWIIKNSWGTDFGDNGYYYLVRGVNACKITTSVTAVLS